MMTAIKIPAQFETGEKISEFRKKLGMSQTDFWARIGTTQSGGSRYESGRKPPNAVQILLIITYGTQPQLERTLDALRNWKD